MLQQLEMGRILAILMDSYDAYNQQLMLLRRYLEGNDNYNEILNLMLVVIATNEQHKRIEGYCAEWIPSYLDSDFFMLYRMTRKTFYALLDSINCSEKEYVGGDQPIPMEQALLMTISWLGRGEGLARIAEIFNVAVSTVYNCTEYMLLQIIPLHKKVIVWPDVQEVVKIENEFRARCGFPGVIGAVDGCNIQFKAPVDQQESYIDKNRNHSIKLQGIVTADKIFSNIMVGFPGSAHDSRVFKNSTIYQDVEENGNFTKIFPEDHYHLVGDKAYPLRNWIMTPYKDYGNLTNRQRRYNTFHSITRIVVEHAFGLLKSRWRILKFINVNSVAKAVKIIVACCILHNFCFINLDFWNEYEPIVNDNDDNINARDVPINAVNKRQEICNLL